MKELIVKKLTENRKEYNTLIKSLEGFDFASPKIDKLPYMPNFSRLLILETRFFILCSLWEESGNELFLILTEEELKTYKLQKELETQVKAGTSPEDLKKFIKETLDAKKD